MKKPKKVESPYFIEYKGAISSDGVKVRFTQEFEKNLKKHLQKKYPHAIDKRKNNTWSFSTCIRYVLEDYLQQQCLENKTFEITLVCFVDYDADAVLDSMIAVDYVLDGYTKNLKDESANNSDFVFANKSSVDEFNAWNLVPFNSKYLKGFKENLKEFQYATDSDNVLVVEIALNNWLDTLQDGVYKYKNQDNYHGGVNLIELDNVLYGLYYEWEVTRDNDVVVKDVYFLDSNNILDTLENINPKVYNLFKKNLSPKDNKLRLKKRLKAAEDEVAKIKDEIENL